MKGLLESRAKNVTTAMKLAACKALAYLLKDDELSNDYILPGIFDKRVVDIVKNAIKNEVK
jgi:malate dehydrogenase (oxaloacetate-decarboxylating)